jgi:hypothetical protein
MPILLKSVKNLCLAGLACTTLISCGGSGGDELWVTDGTTAGTVLVKDINVSGSAF